MIRVTFSDGRIVEFPFNETGTLSVACGGRNGAWGDVAKIEYPVASSSEPLDGSAVAKRRWWRRG